MDSTSGRAQRTAYENGILKWVYRDIDLQNIAKMCWHSAFDIAF